MQADAPDREPHASGTHGEPDAGTSQIPGGFAHSIIDDIRGLEDKARAVLFDALLPGEHPHVVIRGAAGAAIVATGERILVIKTGARSGVLLGARAKAFEYESVIGVRLDTERSPAVIAVDAPVKIASCRVYWADSRDNAWKARNAIPVERPYEPARQAVDAIRGLLEAYRERHPQPGAGTIATPEPLPPRPVKVLPDTEPRRGGGRRAKRRLAPPGARRAVPALPCGRAPGVAVLPEVRRRIRERDSHPAGLNRPGRVRVLAAGRANGTRLQGFL